MILFSSVIVGKSPTGLTEPNAGIMPKTEAVFPNPKTAITCTNCRLVIATMPFTISSKRNSRKKFHFSDSKNAKAGLV